MSSSVFEFVKRNIPLSTYVSRLPQTKGLTQTGRGQWRCNNVIAQGDNTNSMVLNDDEGFFHVFSHGQESGDVIKLYALINNIDSMYDAALGLAQYMDVAIDPDLLKNSNASTQATETMNAVTDGLHRYLMDSPNTDAQKAREYMKARKITPELVQKWKLGLFPAGQNDSYTFLRRYGSDSVLRSLGLLGGTQGTFVSMQGRLAFPIFAKNGSTLSFSSRIIPGVQSALEDSKYINTSNTSIYSKSETLYGQNLLQRNEDMVIVCEGNLDVIALNEMTDERSSAVATCGTALTESHVSTIAKTKPDSVVLAFDSDSAGRKAASSLMWVCNHVRKLYVSPVPEGKDPWDMYEKGQPLWDIDTYTPAPIILTRYAFELYDREEFIHWVARNRDALNFSDDRRLLLAEASSLLGVNEVTLNSLLGAPKTFTSQNTGGAQTNILSSSVRVTISALLGIERSLRKVVAAPMMARATREHVLDILGVQSQNDRDALDVVMVGGQGFDGDIVSAVGSLLPPQGDEEEYIKIAAQTLSRRINAHWRHGIPQQGKQYISSLSSVSTGLSCASGVEQLSFIFELTSL